MDRGGSSGKRKYGDGGGSGRERNMLESKPDRGQNRGPSPSPQRGRSGRLSSSSSEEEAVDHQNPRKIQRTERNSDVRSRRKRRVSRRSSGGRENYSKNYYVNDRYRADKYGRVSFQDRGRGEQTQQWGRGSGGGERERQSYYRDSNNQHQNQSQGGNNNAPSSGGGGGFSGEGLAPVVAHHYNQIEDKGLEAREESRIVILRKYNNWAKSMNFNDAMDEFRKEGRRYYTLVGLDLCCGKGGDLRKWEKSRMIKHVVFVDIAEVSLNNCKERYDDMKRKHDELRERRGGRGPPLFTAEFFVADCTRDSVRSKLSDPNMMFDMVSCQFSFHYCFESHPQAQQMLRNVTENLLSGGYFIGSLPNADRIVKRRRESGQAEFGNEVYKIRFECNEPYPVYGARYFFELEDAVSCPEFLVHFNTFKEMAESFGLELVYRHSFDDFHKLHIQKQDAKQLLNGMGALEAYPSSGDALHFDEEKYDHAREYKDYLKTEDAKYQGRDDICIGTVSSVEWEAIRLYCAFCYRKK